ncbi:hypothetical protein D3C72_1064630 [compost metagenome]
MSNAFLIASLEALSMALPAISLALLVRLLVTVSVRESIRPAWATRGRAVRAIRRHFFIKIHLTGMKERASDQCIESESR